MFREEKVSVFFGVEVPKKAAGAATNYMYAQFSYVSCIICTHCIGLCFGIAIYMKMQDVALNIPFITPNVTNSSRVNSALINTAGAHAEAAAQQAGATVMAQMASYYVWGPATGLFCACCCLGPLFMCISRKFLEDGGGGLQFCCIFEGLCSVINCCSCMSLTSSAILIYARYNVDGSAICTQLYAGGTTTPGPPTVDVNDPSFNKCIACFDGLHYVGLLLAINAGVTAFYSCCIASICATGSKSANDTHQLLDDEMGENSYYH